MGNFEEALKQIQEVIEYKESFFNATDFSLLTPYESLANLYMDNCKYKEAIEPLEKMMKIFKDKVGESDPWYKRVKDKLDKCNKMI